MAVLVSGNTRLAVVGLGKMMALNIPLFSMKDRRFCCPGSVPKVCCRLRND
jgi:hypothetical protein